MEIQGLCGISHTWDFLALPPTFDNGEVCLLRLREKEVAALFVCLFKETNGCSLLSG